MSIVRRFASLLLAVVLTLVLAIPAAAAATLLSGLVRVEDGVCTVSCRGETLAEFPVEDPVHAAITTTSKGTPAVVVTWGDFTQDEKRTVLLPAGLELLRLEGAFSLVTLADTLPDTLAVEAPAAFSSGGLEIGCPGPVAVDGEVSAIYLTNSLSQVTLSDSLDALVYNYHDIPVQGGEGCQTLSSHDITRRQQESWKKDAPAASTPAQPEPENPFANLTGTFTGTADDASFNLGGSYPNASYEIQVKNGSIVAAVCTWSKTPSGSFVFHCDPSSPLPIPSDGSFSFARSGVLVEGSFSDPSGGSISFTHSSGYAKGTFTLVP